MVVPGVSAMVLVLGALVLAARRVGLGARVAGALAAWLALTAGLAGAGVFRRFDALPPRVPLAVICAVAGALTFTRTASGRRLLGSVSLAAIAALQVFRLPVELGLHALFVRGLVPVQMTYAGRNVDIAVGLSAPLVALAFHRAWIGRRALALWHLASLGALLNIVVTATLSFPGPLRYFHEGVANAIVADAPFIWLPTFLVPVAAVSHVISLRALSRGARSPAFIHTSSAPS